MKLMEIDPVAGWGWLWVLSPFVLATLWWSWADWSGYTKRKEMEKMEAIKQARLNEQRMALKKNPAQRR